MISPPPPVLLVDAPPLSVSNRPAIQALDLPLQRTTIAALSAERPDIWPLAIVLPGDDGDALRHFVSTIRARQDPLGDAPILAAGQPRAAADDGVDNWLDVDADPAVLRAALLGWAIAPNPVLDRLAAKFGADEIASLTRRFRDLLIAAAEALAIGAAAPLAHRIAGMAGTLGFASLSAAWNALQYDGDAVAGLAAQTRRTIYYIAQRLENGPANAA